MRGIYNKDAYIIKNWCWSWNTNTLATWWKELTHWKRPWCWERLKAGGEGDDRGWDGWMASLTWWPWVWVSSESGWWTGKPGMLQSMGRKELDTTEWLNWTNITKDNWVFGRDVIFLCCIIYYQLRVIPSTQGLIVLVLTAKIYYSGCVRMWRWASKEERHIRWSQRNPGTSFLYFLPFPGGSHSEHDLFTSSNMHHYGCIVFLSREAPLWLNGCVLLRTNHVDRLPWLVSGEESAFQCRRHGFSPCVGKIPVFLPGKSHGQRSLAGYSPWGCKGLDTT